MKEKWNEVQTSLEHNDFVVPHKQEGVLKAIVFGAGDAGRKLSREIENFNDTFEIVAYADNAKELQGMFLFGKPVISPDKITTYSFDKIIIAVYDISNVTDQLVREYGINPDLINTSLFSDILNRKNSARITALKNVAQIIYDNNTGGSVAELGVFQGEFAKYINVFFPDKSLYLFDTFEGFSKMDLDYEKKLGTAEFSYSQFSTGTSIELVMTKMKNPEKCIVKKGVFPETVTNLEDQFSFVSLDADLYTPMKEGLKYFFPRLSKGGFIFLHDFFHSICTGTRKAVLEYRDEIDLKFVPLGDDSSIAITK